MDWIRKSWTNNGAIVFVVFVCFVGLLILSWSKNVATINQGDYFLAFDSLLEKTPIDVIPYNGFYMAAFAWPYSHSNGKPLKDRNTSWIYLWSHVRLQQLAGTFFDLFAMALISKIVILACFCRLTLLLVPPGAYALPLRILLFLLLAGAFSFAHNIAFLNSFYGEHTFLVFLPVAVMGMFEEGIWRRRIIITTGLLFCSAAKPQYFYLAGLTGVVLTAVAALDKRKQDWLLLAMLFSASLVATYFAFNASGNSANYYNSTYFGSYLRLSEVELNQLGIKATDLACVGVDPWGNRINKEDSVKFSSGPAGCPQRMTISMTTVLAPYLAHPRLLFDLWEWASPVHFTVRYFHVYPADLYVVPSDGKSFHGGRVLMSASALREKVITRHYWIIIALGILIPLLGWAFAHLKIDSGLSTATLLLAVFIPSQFAVCLLGEGVRDLSKHLAAAQFCLDLLTALLLWQVIRAIALRAALKN